MSTPTDRQLTAMLAELQKIEIHGGSETRKSELLDTLILYYDRTLEIALRIR